MSMWQTVKNEGKNLASFNHWPNPFANTIRNIDVLACENTPIAKIKLAFVLFGNAYWSSCVPSPREIERNLITGREQCGTKIDFCIGEGLDIPWISNEGTSIIAKTFEPIVTGFYLMWMAQTAFSFLDAWHSLMTLQYMCDTDNYETILESGHVNVSVDGGGAIPQYAVLWDPRNRYTPPGSAIGVDGGQSLRVNAFGQVEAVGVTAHNVRVSLIGPGHPQPLGAATQLIGTMNPGDIVKWELEWKEYPDAGGAWQVYIEATLDSHPVLAHLAWQCNLFIVTERPVPKDPECNNWAATIVRT